MIGWAPGRPKSSLGLREANPKANPKDNDKKRGLLKKVKSSPLLLTLGAQSPRAYSRASTATPDVPSISDALETEEQLQEIRPVSNMAQITKDSLDRIFVELKSK
jgi:hypothetical protein